MCVYISIQWVHARRIVLERAKLNGDGHSYALWCKTRRGGHSLGVSGKSIQRHPLPCTLSLRTAPSLPLNSRLDSSLSGKHISVNGPRRIPYVEMTNVERERTGCSQYRTTDKTIAATVLPVDIARLRCGRDPQRSTLSPYFQPSPLSLCRARGIGDLGLIPRLSTLHFQPYLRRWPTEHVLSIKHAQTRHEKSCALHMPSVVRV
jgi:hypothetical protein